jgi:predicted 3-demethylubiquinone-9 3-methyltransferase (glyoxalase superfamily)
VASERKRKQSRRTPGKIRYSNQEKHSLRKEEAMQRTIPNLWFNNEAEEAAKFYTSIFKNSKIIATTPYPKAAEEVSGKKAGSVMTVEFELDGDRFVALNGGPEFKFNESISFMVECEDQDEIDYYWDKLTDGGEESVCGWLKDRFGLSWQITPKMLDHMLQDPDQEKVEAVTATFLKMKKLEIEPLKRAFEQAKVPA